MSPALFFAAAAAVPGQAVVRIHSPAIVIAQGWYPAANPRQHEKIVRENGQAVLLRITHYE
ncbi:hypothetical protein H9L12_10425 [Sphingomonas rhizophila]|uniref:Uncharacterized protein n=1 Tax=Sphingomonas rhizophila TaxID=2071607 RepID=A0A7G9SA05_9SPHN|nr:hypothetical protein [Sphingomonas rhizophila]QNN64680.1 hypothetical protein H9L12_10425 [Sphingomonas rhizophila]